MLLGIMEREAAQGDGVVSRADVAGAAVLAWVGDGLVDYAA